MKLETGACGQCMDGMEDPEADGRLLTALWRLLVRSLWRLENGLTLTSGTEPEAELTVGSIDPRSSLELDICRQNLRSLKSPLALAAATKLNKTLKNKAK